MPKMSKRYGLHVARSAGGERAKNTWSALESDSETESPSPSTPPRKTRAQAPLAPKRQKASLKADLSVDLSTIDLFADDPLLAAMNRGEIEWGSLLIRDDIYLPSDPVVVPSTPVEENRGSEAEFWSAPWAAKLHELANDVYDTSKLSNVEFENMMAWLYDKGWWVGDFERSWVSFEPDNLPSRYWIAPADLLTSTGPVKVVRFGSSCCNHSHKKEKKAGSETTQILRFCRAAAACAEEGCRYVHGDTIPRVDRPCAFGASCGATDPTGLKRSQCLYMHPGETWSADLVITRPSSSATVVAETPATASL